MILLDYSQVVISAYLQSQKKENRKYMGSYDELGLVRHFILNSIQFTLRKYQRDYGELAICIDAHDYWRSKAFPNYKKNRKKDDKEMWDKIHQFGKEIAKEIQNNFPYKVLKVVECEADDIIATLCRNIPGKHLIVSSDRDFIQLQQQPNITQFDPVRRKFVCADSEQGALADLKMKIIRGDTGDGIPNILTEDDVFLTPGKRSKPIRTKKAEKWIRQDPKVFCDEEMMQHYRRNQTLIDFECIPENIEIKILESYHTYKSPVEGKERLIPYLMKTGCTRLISEAQHF